MAEGEYDEGVSFELGVLPVSLWGRVAVPVWEDIATVLAYAGVNHHDGQDGRQCLHYLIQCIVYFHISIKLVPHIAELNLQR